jgi:hypothetical protein
MKPHDAQTQDNTNILLVVLHCFEMWRLTLMEEQIIIGRYKVFWEKYQYLTFTVWEYEI